MTKAILFDCFGVLYVGVRSYSLSICSAENRQALSDLFTQADYGYVTGLEFTKQAAELMNMTEQQFIEMCQSHYHKNQEVIDLARELKAEYKIGLLTNANSTIIDQLFTSEEQAELFDDVLVSSSVGMIKPQPEFFELAADRLGCVTEDCVLIDDVSGNISGAEAVGMQGVVFENINQCRRDLSRLGVANA